MDGPGFQPYFVVNLGPRPLAWAGMTRAVGPELLSGARGKLSLIP